MSEVNYVLDRSNLEVRMIDRTIPKVENTSEHKYDQRYGQSNQSNTIKSDTINNTIKAIRLKAIQSTIRLERYNQSDIINDTARAIQSKAIRSALRSEQSKRYDQR